MIEDILFKASIWVIPVLTAITFHEASHGWMASKLGDNTALQANRVTLNPFKHIDPFGTILLPAVLLFVSGGAMMFGFAKPVPVNFANLRKPCQHMIMVAGSGPITNLLLAIGWAILSHVIPETSGDLGSWLAYNIYNGIWINCLLFVFNIIPIPPLDGGRILAGLAPKHLAHRFTELERVGILVVLTTFFMVPMAGNLLKIDLNVFWWLVGGPAEYLMKQIFILVGIV